MARSFSDPFGRGRSGPRTNSFADRLSQARSASANRRSTSDLDPKFGDPEWVDRFINSQSQVPSNYAANQLAEARDKATRALESHGENMSEAQREKVLQIQETGALRKSNWFANILNVLDAPGELVRMGVADIAGVDEKFGVEIRGGDYWNALVGNESLVRDNLGKLAGDDQFLVPGARIAEAAGIKGGVGQFGAGLVADVGLDPFSWVSFGALGLGKKALIEGAQAAAATAARNAAKALADNAVGALVKPLETRFAQAMITRADEVAPLIRDRLADDLAKATERTVDDLDDLELEDLFEQATELATQAEIRAARLGAGETVDALDSRIANLYDVSRGGARSGAGEVTDDIVELVANKRFGSLEARFKDFIDYDLTPDWVTGGMKVAFPFFRKHTPITAGLMRNDFSVRGFLDNVVSKIPGPARNSVDTVIRRLSFEGPELALAARGKAWSLRTAQNAAKQANESLRVGGKAVGSLSSELTKLAKIAETQNIDMEEMHSMLIRLLGSPDRSVTAHLMTADPVMREALDQAHTAVRTTLDAFLVAARESGMDIGEVSGYFPMVASKKFGEILQTLADQGTALKGWDAISDPELRMGYQVLSEFVGAAQMSRQTASSNPGASRFALERTASKTLYTQLDGSFSLADLDNGLWRSLIEANAEGYLSHVMLNKSVMRALDDLAEKNKIGIRLPKDVKPFSENVAEVLDTYVASMSKAINFRHFVREGKRLGLFEQASRRIHRGQTLAELHSLLGKAGVNAVEDAVRIGTELAESREAAAVASRTVAVTPGWTLDVPEAVAEDPRFVRAIERLRKRYATAERFANDTIGRIDMKARDYMRSGVPEPLARQLASATSDKEVRAVTAEIMGVAEERASAVVSAAAEILSTDATLTLKQQRRALRAAEGKANAIRSGAQQTIKDMHRRWQQRFRYIESTTDIDYTFDLTTILPGDQRPWLSLLADDIASMVSEEYAKKAPDIVRASAQAAKEAIADGFHVRNVRVRDLAALISPEGLTLITERLGVKPTSQLMLHNAIERLNITSIQDLVDDVGLRELWRASFGDGPEAWGKANSQLAMRLKAEQKLLEPSIKGVDAVGLQKLIPAMKAGDLDVIRAFKGQFVKLMERAGMEGKFINFLDDGSIIYRPFTRTSLSKRLSLDDVLGDLRAFIPDGQAMPRNTLVKIAAQLTPEALEQAPENVRTFVRLLGPNGRLPFEMEAYENVRSLVRDLASAKAELRRSSRITDKMLSNAKDLDSHLTRTLRDIKHVINGAPAGALTRTWENAAPSLRRLLPSHEFGQIVQLVEYLKGTARLGGPGQRVMERNLELTADMWKPVAEGFDSFNKWVDAVGNELASEAGQGMARAATDLRTFQLKVLQLFSDYGTSYTDEAVDTLGDVAFEASVKEVRGAATAAARGLRSIGKAAKEDRASFLVEGMKGDSPRQVAAFLNDVADSIKEWKPTKTLTAESEMFVSPAVANIGGDAVQDLIADKDVALLLENIVSHVRAIGTPLGMRMLSEDARAFTQWWKAAATVGRPTFVPRNLIGGVFNNRIINVGAKQYAMVGNNVAQYRKLTMVDGLLPEDAIAKLDADFQPYMRGLLDSELLISSYSTDMRRVLEGVQGVNLNPLNADRFFLFRMGGSLMQKSEDFLRAAAFVRHYDPSRPETMHLAKALALAVHFDYQSLTPLERNIKRFIPFFVWTRRNIPLQMRVMMENPGFVNRWQHLATEADYALSTDETTADQFEGSPYLGALAIETDFILGEDTPFWSRLIFDPDVPLKDIEETINALGPGGGGPLQVLLRMLHPGISTTGNVMATSDYPDVNAPTGLRELLNIFGRATDEEEGDIRIPYGAASVARTAVPFLQEWLQIMGISPSDPRTQARLGITNEDDVSIEERVREAALTAGRAVGAGMQTPADELGRAAKSREFIDDLLRTLELQGDITRDR